MRALRSLRLVPAALVCASLGCGSSSSGTGKGAGNGTSTGAGTGTLSGIQKAAPLVALASPVAVRGQASAGSLLVSRSTSDTGSNGTGTGTAPAVSSLPAQIAALQDRLGKSTVADCLAGIQLSLPQAHTACYGPSIAFAGSPDWPSNEPVGPGSSVGCPGLASADAKSGCAPGGDLGMWLAKEPSTGEACTSATMNAQVMAASGLVNSAVTLMAGLICVAHVKGDTLAAGSAPLDYAAVLSANLSGITFSAASVSQLANQTDGRPTYQIAVAGNMNATDASGAAHTLALEATAVHSPGDTADGRLHGYVDHWDSLAAQVVRVPFSVAYDITAGAVRYELRTGQTDADLTDGDLFDALGAFDFTKQLQRVSNSMGTGTGGGSFERAQIDATTGLGTLLHAWQAGNVDGWTRVFQATAAADPAGGADTGVGYFGFGPPLDQPTLGEMDGMWCNWAFPGSWPKVGGPGPNSPNVQGQTMVRDAATGQFVPVQNNILYAPTNTCDVAAAADFRYEVVDGPWPSLTTVEALAPADVTNQLVPYGQLGAIPTMAPPPAYDVNPAP